MPTSEHAGGGEVVLHAGGDGGDAIADVRTTERRGGGIVILHAGGVERAHMLRSVIRDMKKNCLEVLEEGGQLFQNGT